MGMRRNIALNYGANEEKNRTDKIYLYTHWGAEGLEESLAKSLDRGRGRWTDPSYLSRIIFTDMTKDVGDELTGYGLAPYEVDPEFDTLEVDLEKQTVNGVGYEAFISNPQMFAI
jgi:hypothetical protein